MYKDQVKIKTYLTNLFLNYRVIQDWFRVKTKRSIYLSKLSLNQKHLFNENICYLIGTIAF